ncbi:MAG: ABC transporter ATP-binding protein [Microvirga sp.]
MPEPLLQVDGLDAYYGQAHVLQGVTFDVGAAPVAIIGRNGMGKSTLCKAIMGITPPRATGSVRLGGVEVLGRASYRICNAGIAYVPQGRRLFPSLTTDEHLRMIGGPFPSRGRWTIDAVYELFPRLAERKKVGGAQLSGGEQQMLAIGRALMTNPKLLILDEATEGLAPLVRAEIWACLKRLKSERQAIVVIDKNVDALTRFADRHVIIEKGRVVWTGTSAALRRDPAVKDRYLHV